jgi:hypothetical protein
LRRSAAGGQVLYVEIWDDAKRAKEKLPIANAEMIARIERLGYEVIEKVGEWDYLFVPTPRRAIP